MFKTILSGALLFGASIAQAQDVCLEKLDQHFKDEAKTAQDYSYEAVSAAKSGDVHDLIATALAEDEEADRQKMFDLQKDSGIAFYVMAWSAPSNKGTTLLAVSTADCSIKEDLLLYSEE